MPAFAGMTIFGVFNRLVNRFICIRAFALNSLWLILAGFGPLPGDERVPMRRIKDTRHMKMKEVKVAA